MTLYSIDLRKLDSLVIGCRVNSRVSEFEFRFCCTQESLCLGNVVTLQPIEIQKGWVLCNRFYVPDLW
jgi:hypothetical protein